MILAAHPCAAGNSDSIRVSLDAIQTLSPAEFAGPVWRVVREGRDPLKVSRAGGRWDDGTFDVLYTSERRQGAIAEARFHLMQGQPVAPSKQKYSLYELRARLQRALRLPDPGALQALGVNTASWGAAQYTQRQMEYPRTREIGEAARFLGFDGLMAPNARYDCLNVILFGAAVARSARSEVRCHGTVDLLSI